MEVCKSGEETPSQHLPVQVAQHDAAVTPSYNKNN